ncbi:MAG: hypothetical protein JWQ81_3884 [Amycolatopsis sp.]|uniref:acyl-CoA dehydrogenase family protein n=1 Tax=Amycolatopsis sp. TaxID=37632 RepID=UPI0026047B8E|nr:acyl-CoA dehydrogenase family protein [Amycolatopsis sp.]MCU1683145.1 hypothetical protein [Amycolatopsis sp.]
MKFALSAEQKDFAASITALLSDADTATANRLWAEGKPEAGLEIWRSLAGLGVTALGVPEKFAGLDAETTDLVVVFEQLGYHAVPGPWVDTVAVLPSLIQDDDLVAVAEGETLASIVAAPHVPYALDADVADIRISLETDGLHTFTPIRRLDSVDAARRLFETTLGERRPGEPDVARALNLGALTTAAVQLGAGRWLLNTSVSYAKQRRQYGKEIGHYQAVKHLLADVVTSLDFATPLLYAAAITLDSRDVSAAKVAANRASTLAARTGLQVHGALGYTAEYPLGLRLTRIRALAGAWGTPSFHRARVLRAVAP